MKCSDNKFCHFLVNCSVAGFLATMSGASLTVFYLVYIQLPPLLIHSIVSQDMAAKRGGTFSVVLDETKTRSCPAYATYQIQDSEGVIHQLKPKTAFNPPGRRNVKITVRIPSSAALGEAYQWETITYKCNFIRWHTVFTPMVSFLIVK